MEVILSHCGLSAREIGSEKETVMDLPFDLQDRLEFLLLEMLEVFYVSTLYIQVRAKGGEDDGS